MAQLNINLDMDKLTEEILSSSLSATTKGLAITVFNAYMETERDEYVQAKSRERSETRTDMRNGYYERDYTVSFGKLTLKVPRTRTGEFSTELFERYQRMDQAVVLALMESVINGVSTRKVTKIVEQLCGESVSKSFVSNVMKRLDPEIEKFRNRPLHMKHFDFLYVDAMYIKVRENQRVVSKAVYIAQGITKDQRREIIGFMVSGQESTESWTEFFRDLRTRGLTKPRLIISDAHAGLKAAIKHEFLDCPWQRCTVHFMRNIISVMPRKNSKEARSMLRRIFKAPTMAHAEQFKHEFEEYLQGNSKYEAAVKKLDEEFYDALQYLTEPEDYHKSLRTTNNLERMNREIRRRERVIGIFPNVGSAVRLIGALLIDLNETFESNNRKFFS